MPDKTENGKFEEALSLLNEAAREKNEELHNLTGDRYQDLWEFLKTFGPNGAEHGERVIKIIEAVAGLGGSRLKGLAADIEERARKNPWPYVAGAAAGALLVGYLLNRANQAKEE